MHLKPKNCLKTVQLLCWFANYKKHICVLQNLSFIYILLLSRKELFEFFSRQFRISCHYIFHLSDKRWLKRKHWLDFFFLLHLLNYVDYVRCFDYLPFIKKHTLQYIRVSRRVWLYSMSNIYAKFTHRIKELAFSYY